MPLQSPFAQKHLVSGKANGVYYQPGLNETWQHEYDYDAENRLTAVRTSADGFNWETEAQYDYYKHGPLARMTIGGQMVQGVDYAYTLQGWLKGVNSIQLSPDHDMGADGKVTASNRYVARDAFGFN